MQSTQHPIDMARDLMDRHGLRASAVAEQAAQEANLAGRTAEFDHWQSVRAAIAELRRTAAQATAGHP